MLSPLATTLLTWTALYAYVGAYYAMLFLRRKDDREHLAFACLCFALAVWSAGASLGTDAHDGERAHFALSLQFVGGLGVAAFFLEFAAQITRLVRLWALRASYAFCGLAVGLDVLGLTIDPARASRVALWGNPHEPPLTLLGGVLSVGAVAIGAYGVWLLYRGARRERDLWTLVVSSGIGLVAAAYDTAVRSLGIGSIHLLEHAGLIPLLGVAYVLLRRFVRSSEALEKRTDELRKSYGELRMVQEELVRKEQLAAVGELSAVIAHEVRNPLAIIKNAVSSLRRATLRPSDRGVLLGILDEEVDRLNRLVRDLLAYARPVEPRGRSFDIASVVEPAIEAARRSHPDAGAIETVLELEHCPPLHGDPDLLRHAITNVIDNALHAMGTRGSLTVRAYAGEGDHVVVEVTDTGEGMDTLVLSKARDPFFTTRPAGTGLGLAIVDRVVRNHGGTLALQSEAGSGTTVRLTLARERKSSVPPAAEVPT
ncbi:MAG: hypothetical protein IT378_11290 [Sandaracinaceae bacterium]|nr:hypothetical protein [Sandaracinaceae bacterium]